jgi:hypothetical protein
MHAIAAGATGNLLNLRIRQLALLSAVEFMKRFEYHTFDLPLVGKGAI